MTRTIQPNLIVRARAEQERSRELTRDIAAGVLDAETQIKALKEKLATIRPPAVLPD